MIGKGQYKYTYSQRHIRSEILCHLNNQLPI